MFLDDIRKWHKNVPFPPFRILLVKNDLKRWQKTTPGIKELIKFLDKVTRQKLSNPDYGPYWPDNMADIFQSLGIDSFGTLQTVLESITFNGVMDFLTKPTFVVDMNALPLVTASELEIMIKEQCFVDDRVDFRMGDERYWLCPDETMKEVLKGTSIDKEPYKKEIIHGKVKYIHDCDNYAMSLAGRFSEPDLAGLAVGQIWLQAKEIKTDKIIFGHAINIYANTDKEIKLVEPQTDHIFKPKENILIAGKQVNYFIFLVVMV